MRNACPCGYFGDPVKPCTCSSMVVTKYQKRISGPLLDRSENCLNCTFKQDAKAMHINTADARLIRNIQGTDTPAFQA
jgi:predicted ATPase with chaperone activity